MSVRVLLVALRPEDARRALDVIETLGLEAGAHDASPGPDDVIVFDAARITVDEAALYLGGDDAAHGEVERSADETPAWRIAWGDAAACDASWDDWAPMPCAPDVLAARLLAGQRAVTRLRPWREQHTRRGAELMALRERYDRLRRVSDAVPAGLYQYRASPDESHFFTYLSWGATQLLGIDVSDSGRATTLDMEHTHPDDREPLAASILSCTSRGVSWSYEWRQRNPVDGSWRWLRGESHPEVRRPDGLLLYNGILLDVSHRKALEERLRLTANVSALGTLAAGLAHELNNPLSAVAANIEFLRSRVTSGAQPEAAHALEDVRASVEHMQRLVRDLKSFTRGDVTPNGAVDPTLCVNAAQRLTEPLSRHRVVIVDERRPLPPVWGTDGRLTQVFVNLLTNAVESMPPDRALALNEVTLSSRVDGESVYLSVRDNGVGMSPATLARLGEPFVTQRPSGGGTGLGLAICFDILAEVNGALSFESEVGRGTTATVRLVRAPESTRSAAGAVPLQARERPPAAAPGAAAPRPRVLLIDDDRDILVAARRLLMRTVDLEVFSAVSDAVARLEAEASAVALVLCDLMMPDGGAATLIPVVEERWPHLASRIYVLTGGAVSPHAVAFVNSHRDRVLDKAVEFPQLVERVAALIQTADAHA